jgi:hypothetical protein
MGIMNYCKLKLLVFDFIKSLRTSNKKQVIRLSIIIFSTFPSITIGQKAVVINDNLPPFRKTYNVVLMLPFCLDMPEKFKVRDKMADFYEGIEMALVELEKQGMKMNLTVYDTRQDSMEVIRLLSNPEMQKTDLLIGPVYDNELIEAEKFCSIYNIPMVSPLRYFPKKTGGDFPLINCVPPDSLEYFYEGQHAAMAFKNFQMVVVENADKVLKPFAARNFKKGYEMVSGKQCQIIDDKITTPSNVWNGKDSLFVYYTTKNSTACGAALDNAGKDKWLIAGSSDWLDVDRTNYNVFNGVYFYDSYCVPLNDSAYKLLRREFRAKYGGDPQRYTFIGYDQFMFFGNALMAFDSHFYKHIIDKNFRMIHNNYRFVQRGNIIEHAGTNLFYFENYNIYKAYWRQ